MQTIIRPPITALRLLQPILRCRHASSTVSPAIGGPLLQVAALAGNGWNDIASGTAIQLLQDQLDEGSVRAQLLTGIRDTFPAKNTDRLSSEMLVACLVALEERPWPDFCKARKARKPITKPLVALKPLGISPGTIRLADGSTPKGYTKSVLKDAFARDSPADEAAREPSRRYLCRDPSF